MSALLLTAVAVVCLFLFQRRERVELVDQPPPLRQMRFGFLGPWNSPVRVKWRQIKEKVFGPPQIVTIQGTVVELDSTVSALDFKDVVNVQTHDSGARVFVVEDAKAWRAKLLSLAWTNAAADQALNILEEREGQFSGLQPFLMGASTNRYYEYAGWSLNVWPIAQREAVDLTCLFSRTERVSMHGLTGDGAPQFSIRTNFSFGARVQIPRGRGIVLLSETNAHGKVSAAILAPAIHRTTGK